MPTLYDNFERVRQYIDQHQADVDLSAYVSYAYLESKNYIDDNVNVLHGPLFVDYSTPQNDSYTLSSYSHIVAGTEDKTGVSFVATKRKCGGEDGTTYMAAFFTNSDGRSKFAHKTKISDTGVGAQSDDAFMCFNAYGFRIAYSGTEGVSANTEYEILHEGNIGNLGYITVNDISGKADKSELNSYLSITNFVKPVGVDVLRLLTSGVEINSSGYIYPTWFSYTNLANGGNYNWVGSGTLKNYVNGRLAEIEASYVTSSDLPVIDENIIPKETGTYTLGDSSHIYSSAYTQNVKGVQRIFFPNGSSLAINNTAGNASSDRYTFSSSEFKPNATGNISLGSSTAKWGATYTANLYADTIHNFIWTGTSAEYAALDNYTSYQIYMIKEA